MREFYLSMSRENLDVTSGIVGRGHNLDRVKVSENIGATPVVLVIPVDTSMMSSASFPAINLNISNLLFLNKLKQ